MPHKHTQARGAGGMLPQENFEIIFTTSETASGGF